MNTPIKIAYSPCPNDTFMFYGLAHKKIPLNLDLEVELLDIEALNAKALEGTFDLTKISCSCYGQIAKDYVILRAGAALGYNCGPLLLGRSKSKPKDSSRIAIPGELTTANFLFQTLVGKNFTTIPYIFHEIMPAIQKGEVDYGVVIHEGRFTYESLGLQLVQDLGQTWEERYQLPLPLGVIVAKRSLGDEKIASLEKALSQSIEYGYSHCQEVYPYLKEHAQSLDEDVINNHITLYVNKCSVWLDQKGEKALRFMLQKAMEIGLFLPFSLENCLSKK